MTLGLPVTACDHTGIGPKTVAALQKNKLFKVNIFIVTNAAFKVQLSIIVTRCPIFFVVVFFNFYFYFVTQSIVKYLFCSNCR